MAKRRKKAVGRPKGTTVPLVERFCKYVTKGRANECWEWEGSVSADGHGRIWDGKQVVPAHHVAWLLKYNQRVPKGHYCRHHCEEKTCMNPAHLYLTETKAAKRKKK